ATQRFFFGRANNNSAGGFVYDHVTNTLTVRTDGNDVASFNAAGEFTCAAGFVGPLTGNVTGNVSGSAATLATTRSITYTGDVTGTFNFNGSADVSTGLTIPNDTVTNAKAADMATATIKGRTTAGTGDPEDL